MTDSQRAGMVAGHVDRNNRCSDTCGQSISTEPAQTQQTGTAAGGNEQRIPDGRGYSVTTEPVYLTRQQRDAIRDLIDYAYQGLCEPSMPEQQILLALDAADKEGA